jgi:hypothetical protein
MKKFTAFIFLVLFMTGIYSQTIEKLDEKNGFKDFKLGDTYSKWQNQLSAVGYWEDGTRKYLYTGNCCTNVFNYPIDMIKLRFSDNKLVGIYIKTKKFQKGFAETGIYTKFRTSDYERINSSLTYLFGEPTQYIDPVGVMGVEFLWIGKKVLLTSRYECCSTKSGGDFQRISIVDLSFLNNGNEEGF